MFRFILLFILMLPGSVLYAQNTDPEWPCIQVLVPEIVSAVYWPEIIDESLQGRWKEDNDERALAEKLADLEKLTDVERELIQEFAESIPEDERLEKLNILADGIVTAANYRRARFINGIKRYTRQQIAIAAQIEDTLNQLADIEGNTDEETNASRLEIEETLRWHERVYDQREHALLSLCERPVELEEVLSEVLRELSYYLP
ncbi:MAG: hypothetical protein KTR32_37135 [Granulosicoccus sp.]|nr:hypothetical protein [Granulosicoccus sp.]